MLHEIDQNGAFQSSYLPVARQTEVWRATFNSFFLSSLGKVVAAGSYDTNAVRFHDLTNGRDWSAAITAPWLRQPDWEGATKIKGIDGVRKWVGQQIMMHALVAIDGATVLALFRSTGAGGDQEYRYVVVDTSGRSLVATNPTRSQILAVRADTAFALAMSPDGDLTLETRLVKPARWAVH